MSNKYKLALSLVGEFLVEKLRIELEEQGHNNTGALSKSIEYNIEESGGGYNIVITALDYAEKIENGFGKGDKNLDLEGLASWIEQRGIATGEPSVKQAAFLIASAIYRQGSPTYEKSKYNDRGSYSHTKNGRRTGFIQYVVDTNTNVIFEKIMKIFFTISELSLINAVAKNKKTFETA